VPGTLKAEFEELLLRKMQHVRAGDLMDVNTNFGPLVSEAHYKKVVGYIRHGIEVDEAKLLYGGPQQPDHLSGSLKNGYWVKPTVFTDCTDDMKIVKEEIFGPVMCLLTYKTVDEAITRANTPSWVSPAACSATTSQTATESSDAYRPASPGSTRGASRRPRWPSAGGSRAAWASRTGEEAWKPGRGTRAPWWKWAAPCLPSLQSCNSSCAKCWLYHFYCTCQIWACVWMDRQPPVSPLQA